MKLGTFTCHLALLFIVIFTIGTESTFAQIAPQVEHMGSHVYRVRAKLTAYCACAICCQRFSAGKKTALGTDARKANGVAGAPQLVPLGSHVLLPAGLVKNQLRLVDDTGGGMRKMARNGIIQFDVRFAGPRAHQDALNFGKQWVEVFVLIKNPTKEQEAFFQKYASFSWDDMPQDPIEAFLDAESQYAINLDVS